jgi:hypothetical protein
MKSKKVKVWFVVGYCGTNTDQWNTTILGMYAQEFSALNRRQELIDVIAPYEHYNIICAETESWGADLEILIGT